jgi:hypothetical protein
MPPFGPVKGPIQDQIPETVGYGQLSISVTGVAGELGSKHAAGLWAIVGAPNDVKALEASGPVATAAVVAWGSVGVYAESAAGTAVSGNSTSGTGILGQSQSGRAIQGWSQTNYGATGDSQTFAGVRGTSVSAAGTEGWSTTGAGVMGQSQQGDGLYGISHSPNAAGVHGANDKGGAAGKFDGDVTISGNLSVSDVLLLPGKDCAEQFLLDDAETGEPGTVMVVDDAEKLVACSREYDMRVAGVISGASQYQTGMILGARDADADHRPIALMGRVFCKVDADFGAIQPGDLLTTSPSPGHAMKVSDPIMAFGATIGKALRSCACGKGLIPILVALR